MKLSEIRAQFPQYGDLSNDQLLSGIHRKFYSDVPVGKFMRAVEYDTERADPTEGMSGPQTFAAGFNKAFQDLGQGLGQMIPTDLQGGTLVSRQDVAERRKLDAPLMNTGAGMAGNVTGNVAALLPTAFVPGAATLPGAAVIGGAAGLAQPSTSTEETLKNAGIGAVAAPATILAGRGAAAVYQGAKGLAEPLTKAGQDRIAARVLQASADDPAAAAAAARTAKPLVPGSDPTLAQVANDRGLAQLERTVLNNPEYAGPLQQRFANQKAARLQAVRDVAGTQDHYDAINAGRALFAKEDYGNALAQGIDQKMSKALEPQIQNLMERPSIIAAQKDAIRLAKENGENLTDFGSVKGLDWIKKALDNQISKASQPGSAIGSADLRALTQTKNDLMATIEEIAPAYKTANDNFAAMSRQINGMDVGRSLLDKLQKPGSQYMGGSAKEMGQSYSEALAKAQDSVKKATGMDKTISDVMPTSDIARLESVAYDLGRKNFAENAGKATGSNTAQNIISQNMLRRMLGPTGLPETWAESTMLQALLSPVQAAGKFVGADKRIMDRIALGLLDPAEAANLLTTQVAPTSRGLLGSPIQRLMPASASGLLAVKLPQ